MLKTSDGKGRVAAFEILHANSAIRSLIREGKSHQIPSIVQTSRKSGMITMDDSIYELYQAGRVSKDEAITFAVQFAFFENNNIQSRIDALNTEIQKGIDDYKLGNYIDGNTAYDRLIAKYE